MKYECSSLSSFRSNRNDYAWTIQWILLFHTLLSIRVYYSPFAHEFCIKCSHIKNMGILEMSLHNRPQYTYWIESLYVTCNVLRPLFLDCCKLMKLTWKEPTQKYKKNIIEKLKSISKDRLQGPVAIKPVRLTLFPLAFQVGHVFHKYVHKFFILMFWNELWCRNAWTKTIAMCKKLNQA